MSDSQFTWRDASAEAVKNVLASPVRSIVLVILATIIFATALLFSTSETSRIEQESSRQIAEGRFAFSLTQGESSSFTSTDCEAVNQIQGVEAAGAVVADGEGRVIAGSRPLRLLDVTEGYARAAWPGVPASKLGVIAPATLAHSLGLRTGSIVDVSGDSATKAETIRVTAAPSKSRIPGIEDALIRVVAKKVPIRQCVVWAHPDQYAAVGAALRGWLGPDSSLTDFLPNIPALRNPQMEYERRLGSFTWAIAGFLMLAITLIVWIADRQQIALYLLLGMKRAHVVVMASTQLVVLGLFPLQMAATVAIVGLGSAGRLTHSVLIEDWIRLAILILLFPVVATLLSPARRVVDVLKGA